MSAKADVELSRQRLKLLQKKLALAARGAPASAPRPVAASEERAGPEPIAIVGVHGFLPGAGGVREFWQHLDEDRSAITEIPADRFDWREHYDPAGGGTKMRTRWGAFMPDIKGFDPAFFGFLPADARLLDPQMRLLLTSVYQTLEDAGCAPSALKKSRTGVYVALEDNEYLYHLRAAGADLGVNGLNHHPAMVPNRISHFFDLRGPSELVNAMCASGAVAVHRAVSALRGREIDFALVGAARVMLRPEPLVALSQLKVLSPTGAVKSFGEGADGYVRAEGVVSLALKPLRAARRDHDRVYALIRGTAVNHNGRGGMSIAAPDVEAHAEVARRCYEQAGVRARDIGYIEAQGMGNQVGDVAEWEACNRALERLAAAQGEALEPGSCRVSTLKPMIGHLECASALGAILKIIHSFQANKVYKILGLARVNPYLTVEGRPCRLLAATEAWPPGRAPRLAGLHSYGSGGNNAHLLLEEWAPPTPTAPRPAGRQLLVVSGKTPAQLRRQVKALRDHLAATPGLPLANVAFTLQVGRDAFAHRAAFVAASIAEFVERADAFLAARPAVPGVYVGVASGPPPRPEGLAGADGPEALAAAWVIGTEVDWGILYQGTTVEKVSLPGCAFQTAPYWVDAAEKAPPAPVSTARDAGPAPVSAPLEAGPAPGSVFLNASPALRAAGGRRSKRVCVVGAGPSGLAMAKSLVEEGHEPVVFEKQTTLGGLWVLNADKTAGAYRKTRFQSSVFTSTFSDFFLDDIKSTFYDVNDVITYLRGYAEAFGLNGLIRYESEVVSVERAGGRWAVTVRQGGRQVREEFDGVALCQGSFWRPHVPEKEGLGRFAGDVMHSGQYVDNARFRGKRVVVVGGGVSAMDIAEEAAEVAAEVHWSRRTKKLILPRMVGFVPNDCQSPASLLVAENRYNIIDRLRRSMPEYFETYRRSGILPGDDEFRRNPVVHINDRIVGLVADGTIKARGDVARFTEGGCVFAGPDAGEVGADVVVFATGYKNFGPEDVRYDYLRGISVAKEFAMGIFYARDPSLVNTSVLPIAFTGSFYFMEMVARWYAQIMSGAYELGEDELAHRVGADHYLIMAPVSSVLFGLKLGLFPRPEREFREFWRLLNYPAFPMIYRLRGPHQSPDAGRQLEVFRRRSFVKTDQSDPALRRLKHRILAGLDPRDLDGLLARGEITADEHEGALGQRGDPFVLTWEAQYIKRSDRAAAHPDAPPVAVEHAARPADLPPAAVESAVRPVDAPPAGVEGVAPPAGAAARAVEAGLLALLSSLAAASLQIPPGEVEPEKNLSEYGFDSITLTGFSTALSRELRFVELSPFTFLEHPTVGALARFLAKAYAAELREHFGPGAAAPAATSRADAPAQVALAAMSKVDAPAQAQTPAQAQAPLAEAGARGQPRDGAGEEAIAIVGIGARLPGAASVAEFWRNLDAGRSAIAEVPAARWRWEDHWGDPHQEENKTDCKYGAFLEHIDRFDPLHFGISPREATFLDPQHRLLLEIAWEAVESAGYTRSALHDRKVGLFVGVEKQDYAELIRCSAHALDGYMNTGNAHSMLVNRVSRFFSWRGPSVALDTACSGSFVALNLAVGQLRRGQIELALVGGVNVLLTPSLFVLNRKLGMLTSEPVVRPFDRKASGHLNGEGAALLVLKPLSQAERDGDTIYGVVRGAAVEHGGKGMYLTAPNAASHEAVLREALREAGLSPDDVDYVEAQGTGNALTDVMELRTYQRVFASRPPGAVAVGTVKGNVGHLGAASGAVGLIKAVLSMRNGKLPRVLNHEALNWGAGGGELPLRVLGEAEPWPAKWEGGRRVPRRAGVHNYGFGGMNAHAVVEEYVDERPPGRAPAGQVIVLSTRTAEQLPELAGKLLRFLRAREYEAWGFAEISLDEIAFGLQTGREAMAHRAAFVAISIDDLAATLERYLDGEGRADGVFQGLVDDAALKEWRALWSEEDSRFVVQGSLRRRDFAKLARLWVKGASIAWGELYEGRRVRKIPLPTYPFLRERYWLRPGPGASAVETPGPDAPVVEASGTGVPAVEASGTDVPAVEALDSDAPAVGGLGPGASVAAGSFSSAGVSSLAGEGDEASTVTRLVGELTEISVERLDASADLKGLGLDSMLTARLVDAIDCALAVRLELSALQDCETLGDLAKLVRARRGGGGPGRALPREVEVLRRGGGLAPAVWFHAALGTVQMYLPFARRLGEGLPFYAIQSRGVRDAQAPFADIADMAAHYGDVVARLAGGRGVHLGGYSQGGAIAYEVARRLQGAGGKVESLVLVDTPYPPVASRVSRQCTLALTLSNLLTMSGLARPDDLQALLAHPAEGDDLLPFMVRAGLERGLRYSGGELRATLEKFAAIAEANIAAMGRYSVAPLPRPDEPACHFFARRDDAWFFGPELAGVEELAEQNRYHAAGRGVERWRRVLPGLVEHRTAARDHFAMFEDEGSLAAIVDVCRALYGLPPGAGVRVAPTRAAGERPHPPPGRGYGLFDGLEGG